VSSSRGGYRAMEDRAAPQIAGQRNRNRLAGSRVELRPAARQRLARRVEIGVSGRPPPFGRVVQNSRDLVDEAAAVRRRIDPERARERNGATGDRHVLGNGGRSGWIEAEIPLQSWCTTDAGARTSEGAHYIHGIRELHRQRHYRSRRTGAGPQTSRHVYRRRRLSWPPSPRLGNARQLRRRSDERLRFEYLGDPSR